MWEEIRILESLPKQQWVYMRFSTSDGVIWPVVKDDLKVRNTYACKATVNVPTAYLSFGGGSSTRKGVHKYFDKIEISTIRKKI